MMTAKIDGLKFQPWIGHNFGKSEYGKLLILGESHYGSDLEKYDTPYGNRSTSEIIQKVINGEFDINFYRNVGLLFNPHDRNQLWNSVAFANAIQNPLVNTDSQPTRKDIETISPAFRLLLNNIKPDKVLICSKRMWDYWLPENDPQGEFIRQISANGKRSTIWKYEYTDGHCLAMGINHPSRFFSYLKWNPILKEFLSSNLLDEN
jgi:hypothetical protein